jgi:hypothetical protein
MSVFEAPARIGRSKVERQAEQEVKWIGNCSEQLKRP